RPTRSEIADDVWQAYADDLHKLLQQLSSGQSAEAQGSLVRRVAACFRSTMNEPTTTLYPVEIIVDNPPSEQFTILRIRTLDTVGFLYELTNALAISGVYISRVRVLSEGNQVYDTLYVTDAQGQRITDVRRQWELQT